MSQNNTLSVKAKNIVDNFINKHWSNIGEKAISKTDTMKHVIVTLYIQMPNYKAELVAPFKNCIFDLHDYFTQEELEVILPESKAVIKYCYEFADEMRHIDFNVWTSDSNSELVEEILVNDPPYSIYKTPKSVIDLCMRLSGKSLANEKVCIPYGDIADYALYNPEAEYHIGCEGSSFDDGKTIYKNNYVNGYYKILLDSQGIKSETIYDDDSHNRWFTLYKNLRPDYVFAYCPILGQTCKTELQYCDGMWSNPQDVTPIDLAETILVCFASTKPGKYLDFIVPSEFLKDKVFWNLFKALYNVKKTTFNVTIISLPSMEFGATSVDTTLLHIEKDKGDDGAIRLIDATAPEFYNRGGFTEKGLDFENKVSFRITNSEYYQRKGLNVDLLMEVINSEDCNAKYEERINYIQFFGTNEHVSHQYLIDKKLPILSSDEKYIALKELIDIVPTPNVKEDSLVAYMASNYFKIGKLKDVEGTTASEDNLIPFHLKSKNITEDYLLRELAKKYCTVQAQYLCDRNIIGIHQNVILEPEYFLEFKIALPSLEEQERRCKEDARKSLEEARKYLKEADRQLLQSAEEFKRDVHMKKHAIGQTLFNLSNWWDLLQKARKEGHGIVDDTKEIGRIHKNKVADIYTNIQTAIEKLQMQVEHFWQADGLQTDSFSLDAFIKTYVKEHQSPLFVYEYDTSALQNNNAANVTFSKQALTMIFNNIINNACSHGFENKASGKNIVKIELQMDKEQPSITISNNGKPVHEKICSEDVFTYGRSSKSGQVHYGIGGYEVRNLMREFNGEAEFISAPLDDFPVCYKLTFKVTSNHVEH